jgi:hypothetical protein
METTLDNIIEKTLDQLEKVKGNPNKQRYLIEEVTMELFVSSIETSGGGLSINVFNTGGGINRERTGENTHKIIVKLKPKNSGSRTTRKGNK